MDGRGAAVHCWFKTRVLQVLDGIPVTEVAERFGGGPADGAPVGCPLPGRLLCPGGRGVAPSLILSHRTDCWRHRVITPVKVMRLDFCETTMAVRPGDRCG